MSISAQLIRSHFTGGMIPFSSLPNGSSAKLVMDVRWDGMGGVRGTDFFCDSFDSVECETD